MIPVRFLVWGMFAILVVMFICTHTPVGGMISDWVSGKIGEGIDGYVNGLVSGTN